MYRERAIALQYYGNEAHTMIQLQNLLTEFDSTYKCFRIHYLDAFNSVVYAHHYAHYYTAMDE